MTRTVQQLLKLATSLGIEIPEAPEGGFVLSRCYAVQCGYPEGWSWVIRSREGFEWLASQWGAKDLLDFHRDGLVYVETDEVALLVVGPASQRKDPLTHFGQSRPFAGCKKGRLEIDSLTLDHDKVTCPDCRKTVRRTKKAAVLAAERERRHQEYLDELSPEQRAVRDRFWGVPK